MGRSIIKTVKLSKWYGNIIGINDINLKIGRGMYGLLGVNGSGKSTFIKIATGLMRQSRGDMVVLDEDPWDNPKLRLRIGYCPEGFGLYDEFTGEEFLMRKALLRGYSLNEARMVAKEFIKKVGLQEAAGRKIKGYSRGMRQRIKFAHAIMFEPELLILDEPFNGTDPFARIHLMDLIREMVKKGVNVLFASHILFEVEELTENVIVFHRGSLVAEGRIWEIRSLLDSVPLKIFFRTKNPHQVSSDLLNLPEVEGVFKHPEGLVAHVRKPFEFYPKLQKYVVEEKPPIEEFYPLDESLENLFGYLLRGVGM
ncbi:MAG: ABC transporter ATP-binding protein [Thermoplasmata archaeon]|nr:ABC transporter ATP-binding protein [Thermoplasmata archaeon]